MACEILPVCVKEILTLLAKNPIWKTSFIAFAQAQILAIDAQLIVLQASLTRLTAIMQQLEATVLMIKAAIKAAYSQLKMLDIMGLSSLASVQCPPVKKIIKKAEDGASAMLASVFHFKDLQDSAIIRALSGQAGFELAKMLQQIESVQDQIASISNLRFLLQSMIDCLNELMP